jgi:hypothetical protein
MDMGGWKMGGVGGTNYGQRNKMKKYPQIRMEFVGHMNHELEVNEPRKGKFSECRVGKPYVEPWLEEHTAKLYDALERGDAIGVREFCADIANIVMKIEECFGPDNIKKNIVDKT